MNWQQWHLLRQSEEAISDHAQWSVLVALVDFADKDEAICCASKPKIAKRCRYHVDARGNSRTVDNALNELEKAGHITKISKGGGKGNENNYRVHIRLNGVLAAPTEAVEETPQLEPQTPQNMRGNEEPNPAKYATQTPQFLHNDIPKPRNICGPYKVEGELIRNEEFSGGGVTREARPRQAPPPPQEICFLKTLIGQAIHEINGHYPNLNDDRDKKELVRLAPLLKPFPSEEAAAAEIVRRYKANWDKPRPPYLSQIVDHWDRMERIAELKLQQENQNERLSTGMARNTNLTPRQRASRELDQLLVEQGIRPG